MSRIPAGEVTESDFGAFQEEARERPAPIRDPQEVREFLAALHERARAARFPTLGGRPVNPEFFGALPARVGEDY
jgi:hypothetical protein